MSGGAITDHRYDISRLSEWASEIKYHSRYDSWVKYSEEFIQECDWVADLMDDLRKVVNMLDYVFSGDSGEEQGIPAIRSFKEKWCKVSGISNADMINMGVYIENCLNKVRNLEKEFPPCDDPLGLFKKEE